MPRVNNDLRSGRILALILMIGSLCATAFADQHDQVNKPRARDAGVPFLGTTGEFNAITDVPGVEVGQVTLISGDGAAGQSVGNGPVRTGVTAIFPRGKDFYGPLYAATFALNGVGELTGKALIDEYGEFVGPIVTTGTGSVGVVRDAIIEWYRDRLNPGPDEFFPYVIPVVGETWDGRLNDTLGFHVTRQNAFEAMAAATGGPVQEGNVGGGTGMVLFHFAGGIGTSSRVLAPEEGGYTVGVMVQANFGKREHLIIAGVPVGELITDYRPVKQIDEDGSILITIATNAPLLPHQLVRVARRASHGLARTGGMSGNTSGDIFIAFSTEVPSRTESGLLNHDYVDSQDLDPIFTATILATEEAIINVLFAARDMSGLAGNKVFALPQARAMEILRQFNRTANPLHEQ